VVVVVVVVVVVFFSLSLSPNSVHFQRFHSTTSSFPSMLCSHTDMFVCLIVLVLFVSFLHLLFASSLPSADMARRNPFHPVPESASLLDVAEKLAKGTHRVPVINEGGDVINIISQSSLVKFLLANQAKLVNDLSHKVCVCVCVLCVFFFVFFFFWALRRPHCFSTLLFFV
jgi:CBS domain-containing protein